MFEHTQLSFLTCNVMRTSYYGASCQCCIDPNTPVKLDDGSEVYTGNQKHVSVPSAARALLGPRVSDFPCTPRESIV